MQTEEAVCRVGGITCNAEGFVGETGAVDVLEGGRETPTIFSAALMFRSEVNFNGFFLLRE